MLAQEGNERPVVARAVLEIAAHARAQALGFADVEHRAVLVLEQVAAGLHGQVPELLLERAQRSGGLGLAGG
jgi:hypothetical protein